MRSGSNVLIGVAIGARIALLVALSGCAAETKATRGDPATAPAQAPQLSVQDRALLLRLFLETSGTTFGDRGAASALVAHLYATREIPLDASATTRLEAWRATHQSILAFLVSEDPYAAARYAEEMRRLIPQRPRMGPLSDEELTQLEPKFDVGVDFRRLDSERYLSGLNAAALAERLVAEQRLKVGSTATHPPTRREVAAALLLRSPHLSPDDDVDLRAQGGDPCSVAVRSGRGALKAVWVSEEAYRAEFDSFTTDPKALGISVPEGFVLDVRLVADGFEARLTGLPESLVSGEVWTLDSGTMRPTRQGRGCTASPVDSAIFAPLLSLEEERALADLVGTRALVDAQTRAGVAVLDKVVETYRSSDGVSTEAVAAVLAHALRQHGPAHADDARRRIHGFVPHLDVLDGRPLLETETRDLLTLVVAERVSRVEDLRLTALLQKVHPNGDITWEPVASGVLAIMRAQRPEQEQTYLRRVRPAVCETIHSVMRALLPVGGLHESDASALRAFGEQTLGGLRATGFEATLVDAASPETFAIDARMPAASVIAGHHVRFDGEGVRVVHDACSDTPLTP